MPHNVILWTFYEVIKHCDSIEIIFEFFTCVVGLMRSHPVMTSKKLTRIHIFQTEYNNFILNIWNVNVNLIVIALNDP